MVGRIEISHTRGSYPVVVQPGAKEQVADFLEDRHPNARVMVIADATVAAAQRAPMPDSPMLTFHPGERHKTRETWARLSDSLLDLRYGRDSVLIAFGGGVTTDLVGFVAATLHRGVPWIAVPTTTLAMLDAAVGGKTGVDTPVGKNLVGAFHPPSAVFADPMALQTLTPRVYIEGLAEAVKHAAILDAAYGEWMIEHAAGILSRAPSIITELVRRSVLIKCEVVSQDEHEGGRRAILNAGHTLAHALEQASDYLIPHGEAVAIGLVMETRVAEQMGIAASGTAEHLAQLLARLNLPHHFPKDIDRARFFDAMDSDKKNREGVVRAALLANMGSMAHIGGEWTWPLDIAILREIIQ